RNFFGEESFTVVVTVKESLPASWAPLKELEQLVAIKKINVSEKAIEFSCTEDLTPYIVRFFVEKGLNVMGVHKKEFGLDEIYQRYFENNLKKNISDGKSAGLFQRSFFKRSKIQ
ncbi:MAG: ABC transporter ATP-binding protein, partial [Ginsengibacter sp.]